MAEQSMFITLHRERLDDDSDDTSYELEVFFDWCEAEPDVGIYAGAEAVYAKFDGVNFDLTDAEVDWLTEQVNERYDR